jgi:hypothetical protein
MIRTPFPSDLGFGFAQTRAYVRFEFGQEILEKAQSNIMQRLDGSRKTALIPGYCLLDREDPDHRKREM